MFAYVEGEPVGKGHDYVVIAVGGLGFRVFVPPTKLDEICAQPMVKLHTHMAVREDNLALFGLQSEAELALFRHLISVSGVGPRLALSILSSWTAHQLCQILANEDICALTSVSGVGRKTAQRLLLELKDKVNVGSPEPGDQIQLFTDAEAALAALGFRSAEVRPVLRALARDCASTEELVRAALARLAGGEK